MPPVWNAVVPGERPKGPAGPPVDFSGYGDRFFEREVEAVQAGRYVVEFPGHAESDVNQGRKQRHFFVVTPDPVVQVLTIQHAENGRMAVSRRYDIIASMFSTVRQPDTDGFTVLHQDLGYFGLEVQLTTEVFIPTR